MSCMPNNIHDGGAKMCFFIRDKANQRVLSIQLQKYILYSASLSAEERQRPLPVTVSTSEDRSIHM